MPRQKPKKPKPINLVTAQAAANKYVQDYMSTTPLGLPELDEEKFKLVMDAIGKAMTNAWADGYMKRNEEV